MTQPYPSTIHERSVCQLADVWREFAQLGGDRTDPAVQLLGVPAERSGFNLGFFVPCTGHLVVVHTAAPYPTEQSAMGTMWLLAQKLHDDGLIDLGQTGDNHLSTDQEAA